MAARAIWTPQQKQIDFMSRREYEVLYGGAAGGGKSDALLAEGLRQVDIPHYRGIIFRRTYPQLTELIDRSAEIYKPAFKGARFNDNKHVWTFPSGAKIFLGAMQHEKDRKNYQGKRYDYIGFDELTHFTWKQYSYMFSRNRPSGAGTRVYMRASTNPGGVGHAWVKSRFIEPFKPYESYPETVDVMVPGGQVIKMTRYRTFINSSVFDNQILLKNDPQYLASLAMLPEAEMKALMYGDWNSFQGQAFPEFRDDTAAYYTRKFTHVIEGFPIPPTWRRFRSFDWGYSKPYSVAWYAMDHDGILYRYREMYGSTGEPNVGSKETPQQIAMKIRDIEEEHEKGLFVQGYADPSIFDAQTGESIADSMAKYRVYWEPSDNKRLPGKMQCHYRLAFDEEGRPMFYVFRDENPHFIRTIPSQVYSETHPEDIDTDGEDHIYDEWRYMCAMNPIAPRRNVLQKVPEYNPLTDYSKSSGFYDRHRGFMNS
ncbi:MAG: terminase large subunit domain-containing protein [Sphaerochaetaceae bacterium]